jgi:multiple sugar transport system substrate-binding protein
MERKTVENSVQDASEPGAGRTHSLNLTRRDFIRLTATASAGLVAAACAPGGAAPTAAPSGTSAPAAPTVLQGTTLNMLQWSHFVPEGDKYFDAKAAEWGQKNNVQVKIEHINANDIPARIAAAVQAQSGPDIIQYLFNWAWLYPDALVDVSDIAEKLGKQQGGWYSDIETYSKPGGTWKAVPFSFYGQSLVYRGDWFKENNWTTPKTTEDLIALAKQMKAGNHPFGQALGHSFTDPRVFWYPWLWSYGGKEVMEDGKTIALDSPETLEAVEKAVELYDNMVQGTLSWDDNSNNRAFLAGQVGATTNAASIYFTAKREKAQREEQKKSNAAIATPADIEHAVMPAGKAGNFSLQSALTNGITAWSKNQSAAKDFITAMMQPDVYTEYLNTVQGYNVGPLHAYDNAPVWQSDPKLLPFREVVTNGSSKWPGWPGPPSAASSRVAENYIIIDLFAKAASREFTPKESIANAVTQLGRFYK